MAAGQQSHSVSALGTELEGEPDILTLYSNPNRQQEDSTPLIAQPQEISTSLILRSVIDKWEAEKRHQTEKHEVEMEDMKQQMQHREKMRQMEVEQIVRQLTSQEAAFRVKLERIQMAHVSELLEKDEKLELTQTYYESWIEDFKKSYQEHFDAKEEKIGRLREQMMYKDQQIRELQRTVEGLRREGTELVILHKRPIWKKFASELIGREKKKQKTWQYFTGMNVVQTQGGRTKKTVTTLPASMRV